MYHHDPELQSVLLGRLARQQIPLIRGCILLLILSCVLMVFACAVPEPACAPSMQQCGSLGDVMYPFGKKGSHCGASPKFLLSNCSGRTSASPTTVHWEEFAGDPAVLGLSATGSVNLTWTSTSTSCQVHPREKLPLFLPNSSSNGSGVDLRNSPYFSAFSLSPNNIFLLFNCTDVAHTNSSNYIESDSKNCKSFKNQCSKIPAVMRDACVQFLPQWQLNLPKAMNLSKCSHFQFLLTLHADLPVDEWKPHVVQLVWAPHDYNFELGSSCRACEHSKGTCGYADDGTTFQCFCSNNQFSTVDCNHLNGDNSSRLKITRIMGALAGLVVMVSIAAMLSLWWFHRKRRIFTNRSGPSSHGSKLWSQRACLLSSKLGPICAQEYSYQEVLQATQGFADDNIIGDGGFGSVYLGTLNDGHRVAVKRLFHDNFSRMDHFYNEIQILSRLDHPKLVKFYGFCCEDERDLLLVFEYLCNGSVFDQLHHEDAVAKGACRTGAGIPSWRVRLTLAMETAEALSYLHNSINPPILHRDVKTTNILLDEGFHAKLADFGLSRLVPLEVTHVSTMPQGTPGYVDPEYQSCYRLTDKSDVYSFGVVLMELVSSKRAVDMSRSEKEINLSSMALLKEKKGTWKELVDTHCWRMDEDMDAGAVVEEVVQLAFRCLQPEKADRPGMSEVAAILTRLWQSHVCQSSNE